jgi:multicomponent Na+:H+ antiporter subunit D
LLFLLPALSLAGFPPFSGFIGKTGLVEAGLDQASWTMIAVALVGSLLTLVSMLKIWTGLFWGESNTGTASRPGVLRHHPLISSATGALVAVGLAIALFGGPIYRYCERAADSIVHPTSYQHAVNGDETAGSAP